MRDFVLAIISGGAALALKAYDERYSLVFSPGSLKYLLFPAVVGGTVFLTLDVVRAARHLTREVKVESDQEIELYPSLVLPEKHTEKRAPSFYRLKIAGMATSLIAVFLLACILSWRVGDKPAPSSVAQQAPLSTHSPTVGATPIPSSVHASSPPVVTPIPTAVPTSSLTAPTAIPSTSLSSPEAALSPVPSPSAAPSGRKFNSFMGAYRLLHKGYKVYGVIAGANNQPSEYYVRLGALNREQIRLLVYVVDWYSVKEVMLNIIDNYDTIVEDLKALMRSEGTDFLGIEVSKTVVVYIDIDPHVVIRSPVEAKRKDIDFQFERRIG